MKELWTIPNVFVRRKRATSFEAVRDDWNSHNGLCSFQIFCCHGQNPSALFRWSSLDLWISDDNEGSRRLGR